MRGLGKNSEFGHICVFEKNEFGVLDAGAREDVWRDDRGWGGTRDRGWGSGVSAEGVSRISRGERVEGVSWTLDTPG